jgi:hypothetical protein
VLLSRHDCPLCDDFAAGLAGLQAREALPPLEIRDVDDDPLLARRYGLDVPVLLLDGIKVCQHRLDEAELKRLLRPR